MTQALSNFSPSQADLLKRFLASPDRPEGTFRYEETTRVPVCDSLLSGVFAAVGVATAHFPKRGQYP